MDLMVLKVQNWLKPIGTPGLEPAARLNGSCSLPIGEVFRGTAAPYSFSLNPNSVFGQCLSLSTVIFSFAVENNK